MRVENLKDYSFGGIKKVNPRLVLKNSPLTVESSVPLKQKFISAKFCPANDNQFAVLFENSLCLCETYPSYEAKEVFETELERKIRIGKTTLMAEQYKYANFIWDD